MTEAEWAACQEPQLMLEFLRGSGRASERKLRLFAVACCRRIWDFLLDGRSREAVEVGEQYADGRANQELLVRANKEAEVAARVLSHAPARAAVWVASTAMAAPRAAATTPCRAGTRGSR